MADEDKTAADAAPGPPAAEPETSEASAEGEAEAPPAAKPKAAPAKKPAAARKASTRRTKTEGTAKTPAKKAAAANKERKPLVRVPRPQRVRGKAKERRGIVVSSGMDKTIVVRVDSVHPHRAYKKVVRRSTKFHAHDEQNAAGVGDVVRIVETRPISKTKSWRLAEILEVAK